MEKRSSDNLRNDRWQPAARVFSILLLISQCPSSAQITQDGYPSRDRVSVRKNTHKKKGVYLSPDICESQEKQKQKKSALERTRKTFDPSILDGLHPYKVERFSSMIVGLNSKYNIYVIDDPSVLKGRPFPAIYSASKTLFDNDSIGRATAELGWTGIYSERQTLSIREFGSFIILTDRLDSVRCQDNSTTILHDLDQTNLRLFMTNNGKLFGDGQVNNLDLVITHNGTADLQKLKVENVADVTLFSNGTANINCSGHLRGKSFLPEQITSCGSPKRVDLARLRPAHN